MPAKIPNIKYRVPISLWFVEQTHLSNQLNILKLKNSHKSTSSLSPLIKVIVPSLEATIVL
jgi:hypothetical protein